MSDAVFALGTLMQVGDGGSPEAFATIAEVRSIGGPNFSRDVLDTTNHSSPSAWREKLSGLKNGGQITFTIGFNPSLPTHNAATGVVYYFNKDTPTNWRIVLVNGLGRWDAPCICANFGQGFPIDNVMTADVTLEVAGQPILTIGA